jgi:transmembrane sensor
MDKYNNYNFDFFLSDDTFVAWVRSGKPVEGTVWEPLIQSDSEIQSNFELARKIVLEWQQVPSQLSDLQLKKGVERIMSSVSEGEPDRIRRIGYSLLLKIAAAVLFTVGLAWLALEQFNDTDRYAYGTVTAKDKVRLIEITNGKNKDEQISLPDGSTVVLAKGSRLSYSKSLLTDSTRDVYLKGDGFFQVTKDKDHPFKVFTNGLVTRVLGTSFKISSKGLSISVAVRSGKVAVYSMEKSGNKPKADILLMPNQEAVFAINENEISKKLVEQPVVLQGEEKVLSFDYVESPVSAIFDALEKAYGIKIDYDPQVLKNCTITLPLKEEPFFTKLDIICRTIQASYELSGDKVIISSKGCN